MRIRAMVLGLSAAICLAFGTSAAPTNPPRAQAAVEPTTLHRIIVKLRGAVSATLSSAARALRQSAPGSDAIAALAGRNNLTVGSTRSILPGLHVMNIVPQTSGESLQAILTRLRADPKVEYGEPDQRRYAVAARNDPLFVATPGATGQWYLLALAALAAAAVGARRRQTVPSERSMQRRSFVLLAMTATMMLALLGAAPAAYCDSRWVAGMNYFVINPAQPTGLPAGKIQVTEIFSYACPGCNRFYPVADRLQASLPANAVMDYLPASFRPDEDWPMFQRAYFAAKEMGIDKRTHDALFDTVWKSGELAVFDPATQRAKRPAPTITDAARFYAQTAGVKPETFIATAMSFAVEVRIRQADELIRNYGVSETPSIVVNGKYRLNPVSAGGYEQTIELVKWLVAQEGRPGDRK